MSGVADKLPPMAYADLEFMLARTPLLLQSLVTAAHNTRRADIILSLFELSQRLVQGMPIEEEDELLQLPHISAAESKALRIRRDKKLRDCSVRGLFTTFSVADIKCVLLFDCSKRPLTVFPPLHSCVMAEMSSPGT